MLWSGVCSLTRMSVDLNALNERLNGLPKLLGIRFVEASLDRLVAELEIRDELRTGGGRAHGGTLMAFGPPASAARRRASSADLDTGQGTCGLIG